LRAMPIPAILSKRLTGWRLIPGLPIIHEPCLAEGAASAGATARFPSRDRRWPRWTTMHQRER
jgi:hypothetical protein